MSRSLQFIIIMGIVSFFADITYEGARSYIGPFLSTLGASGLIVGTVAGLGELIGYTLRLGSGYLTDKTKSYWFLTIMGYIVTLLAVPMLAFANHWQFAAMLIIAERLGKAIRSPARDAMLSFATKQTGRGFGFGLHEVMDQCGAITGPLIVSGFYYGSSSLKASFAVLAIPATIALSFLFWARGLFPEPHKMEVPEKSGDFEQIPQVLTLYYLGIALVAAGYVDFPLIAYHFQKSASVSGVWIGIFYAIAMGVEGLSSLIFGRIFDKEGIKCIVYITAVSAFFAPLVFFGGFTLALMGMIVWGIGMGAQTTILRAYIASKVSVGGRGRAYGIANTIFGIAWFLGSVLMGFLYDISYIYLVIFSMAAQIVAVPVFIRLKS
jgi:MFS family permease